MALLYLERRISPRPFTRHQRQLVSLLGTQAVITTGIVDYYIGEMKALEAKVNPQFIHNTLSVVAELVVSDAGKAEEALVMLSRLYRYVLESPMDRIVSLSEEVAICRDYLALEQHRLGDRMKSDITISGPADLIHIPALILQPLVENGIRHGIARKVGEGHLRVEVDVTATTCRLRVSDDGAGWDEQGRANGIRPALREGAAGPLLPGHAHVRDHEGRRRVGRVTIPREGTARRGTAGPDGDSQNGTNPSRKGQNTMATTSPTVDPSQIKLLTFLYKVYVEPELQSKFRETPELAMDEYGLSLKQKAAIYHSGLDPLIVKDGKATNAEWWEKYALNKAGQGPAPSAHDYEDSGPDRSRMAGVVELLVDELTGQPQFDIVW